jgi:hypothetical protein
VLSFFLLETAMADPCQSSTGSFWPIAAVCDRENETGVPPSLAMTMRYAHLSPDHLLDAVKQGPLAGFDSLFAGEKRKTPEIL